MAKIVAVVAEPSVEAMAARAAAALGGGADLVEFRLDALPRAALADAGRLADAFGPRAIATLRSTGEGGASAMTLGERLGTLRRLAEAGFAYLDVELAGDAPVLPKLAAIARSRGTALIASAHPPGFPTAAAVEGLLRSACGEAAVGKVAAAVPSVGRALEFAALGRRLRGEGLRCCLIATGMAGRVTRALAGPLGAEFNYVVAPGGRPTEAGQLDLPTARALAGESPLLLGLLGQPVADSASPAMHNAALGALGIPGIYLPLETPPGELGAAIDGLGALGFRGLNVTAPHKVAVLPYLDALDGEAKAIGAVNTIVLEPGGKRVGYNTDAHGFRALLAEAAVEPRGRSALLLGAGGAARAAAAVLLALGASVAVWNRTPGRAEALAAALPSVEVLGSIGTGQGAWDIVVNCTPGDPPVPSGLLAPRGVAIDLAYRPEATPFLRRAAARGCRAVGGLAMLVHQGARSLALWLGREPPLGVLRRAAEEAVG